MGHADGLLLVLDLLRAVDADREGGRHVAPPCAVFSPIRAAGTRHRLYLGACIVESRLDPVKLTLDVPRKLAREVDHPATLPRGGRLRQRDVGRTSPCTAGGSFPTAAGLDHLPSGPRGSTVSGRDM